MSNLRSKIYFIILTALFVGGFPNFMAQEAYAAGVASVTTGVFAGDSTAKNNIVVVFDAKIHVNTGVDGATSDQQALFNIDGAGVEITSANILIETTQASPVDVDCVAGAATVTIILDNDLATDAVPSVVFTNTGNFIEDCDGASTTTSGETQTAVDGLSPEVSSVTVTSTTTIDVLFSESIDAATVVAGDFTVTLPSATIDSVSGSTATLTLTSGTTLSDSDTPTITIVGGFAGIDDNSTKDNTISSGATIAN